MSNMSENNVLQVDKIGLSLILIPNYLPCFHRLPSHIFTPQVVSLLKRL